MTAGPARRLPVVGTRQVVVRVQPPLGAALAALRGQLTRGAHLVCELAGPLDLVAVDALARLQLRAQRCGARVEVQADDPVAAGLLALTGLSGLLGGQPAGQAEAGEQRRVEEVVHVHQPPA